jgi:AraC-like DNA-binding protein
MDFSNLRLERIKTIVRYTDNTKSIKATARRDHIIGVCESGVAHHDFGYKRFTMEPGCIYFFNQRDNYTADIAEIGTCYSIHFTTSEPLETESFCRCVSNPKEIVRLISKVEHAWLQKRDSELQTLSLFYRLCDELLSLYRTPYTQKDARLTNARAYIDLHFKEDDCLERATALCGVSRRRFNDVFKAQFHTTPNRYLTAARIAFARELLEVGYLSTHAISELCGFSDAYYFSKVFKTQTGMTPGQYKQLQGGTQNDC